MTLLELKERLKAYMDAEIAVLQGKEIHFEGEILKREDLKFIQAGIKDLENKIARKRRGHSGPSLASFD